MAGESPRRQPEADERRAEDLLDGWKAIADYLDREPRTVQRWEKSKGLPVRRLAAASPDELPRVFAYKSEIAAWWRQRETKIKEQEEEEGNSDAETEATKPEPVVTPMADPGAAVPEERPRLQRLLYFVVPLVLASTLAAVGLRIVWPKIHETLWPRTRVVLAVMPFQNSSGDAGAQQIARGLTDEMVSRLGRLHPDQLGVIELSPSDASLAPKQIGHKFKAEYVLEGSVRSQGNRVAITARLISVKEQTHVTWGNSYASNGPDPIETEIEVAGAIVAEVLNVLPPGSRPARQVSHETYEAYLTGRALWNRRTTDSLNKAVDYFQQAIKSDPMYAPAYVGLADCHSLLGSVPYTALPPKEAFPKAKAAAQKALQLDDTLAEAHLSLGYAELVYDRNFPEAEKEFKRALDLRPGSATVHQFYGYYLTAMGRLDEAIEERREAQQLQPDSPLMNSALGEAFYQARKFDNTIAQSKKSLVLDPSYAVALINLGRAYEQKGMYPEAIQAFQRILAIVPDDPGLLALIGHTYAVSGERAKARAIIGQLQRTRATSYVPSLYLALVYTGLGEKDAAFQWLEKAFEERCDYLVYLPSEPLADPLRSDPRFSALLKRLGLKAQKIPAPLRSQ